jgi:hypothetical protein
MHDGMYRQAGFASVAAHPIARAPHTVVVRHTSLNPEFGLAESKVDRKHGQ